jgi:hypothetical protein
MAALGSMYLLAVILALVVIACWIALPFAIIGTKQLLRQLIVETKRTNELLERRLPALRPPPA